MVEKKQVVFEIPFSIRKFMTPEEQHAAIRSFKNFDKSGDGVIVKGEFRSLLNDMGRTEVTDAQVDEWFQRFDADGDGHINF